VWPKPMFWPTYPQTWGKRHAYYELVVFVGSVLSSSNDYIIVPDRLVRW
jgi:hypothetical protein